MREKTVNKELLDNEWLQLIMKAKQMGIKKEEVKDFLLNNGVKELSLKSS